MELNHRRRSMRPNWRRWRKSASAPDCASDANLSLLSRLAAGLAVQATAALLPLLTTVNQYASVCRTVAGPLRTLRSATTAPTTCCAPASPRWACWRTPRRGRLLRWSAQQEPAAAWWDWVPTYCISPRGRTAGRRLLVGDRVATTAATWCPTLRSSMTSAAADPTNFVRRPDGSIDIIFAP